MRVEVIKADDRWEVAFTGNWEEVLSLQRTLESLNPDGELQLSDYRQAQAIVRQIKMIKLRPPQV